ncbi:MAG TPA: EamA family transporter [Terriglobales bacterium]|jgi:drug/metabolite transporter (DMT)-like permease|nr:EamA family transporter [Terriglobales bacterium]
MENIIRPPSWKILLAFATIYFVWGSTFLAIRVGVHEVPPFLLAGLRFFAAGIILYGWMRATGTPSPTRKQWTGATLLGAIIFVMDYGCLFWAEQRVPSGIAAVILASIPVFMTLLEIVFLRTQRLTFRLSLALLIGIAGVAVLMNHSFGLGEAPIDRVGAAALIVASFSWSVAAILTRRIPLPDSKPMSAATQMLTGGVQLMVLAGLTGEFSGFHPQAVSRTAWFALIYLIIAGSIAGFTAYVWLLHYESPTRVGTYAYVNPVVAVILGYFVAGEALGRRTILGTLLIIASVITITTTPNKSSGSREGADLAVAGAE